ncbi:MAG TPA: ABC transporter permease [Caldisericia bacterium]|nr:ABC transporter permease [Caldisericia bacterium]HPF48507.1 ABC transporter permease [Caldisericia bacterium]HPI83312.1 ABC transporter permease [Caldisericia bacterium]HPQ92962.1 ABC transporter permease [Caldisericia bacterium]HRV75204.1 ABC transporter permease [Caldisericia bacterium]
MSTDSDYIKRNGTSKRRETVARVLWMVGGAIILPAILFLVWELAAVRLGSNTLLPRVGDVFEVLANPTRDLLGQGSLLYHVYISTIRVLMGFVLGALVAVPLGMAMGLSERLRNFVTPFIELMRPLCPVAWIPFAIIIFGGTTISNLFGQRFTMTIFDHIQTAQLFIIAWGAFFPVLINTIDGVRGVRQLWLEAAHTMGANRVQKWAKVILPASFPQILTGLKVGLGVSWMVVIAAELFPGPTAGVGYIMMEAYAQTEIQILAAGLITVGVIGALLNAILWVVHMLFANWQAKER